MKPLVLQLQEDLVTARKPMQELLLLAKLCGQARSRFARTLDAV
jgi:hypothetical protein